MVAGALLRSMALESKMEPDTDTELVCRAKAGVLAAFAALPALQQHPNQPEDTAPAGAAEPAGEAPALATGEIAVTLAQVEGTSAKSTLGDPVSACGGRLIGRLSQREP
jgi:hypothetical protein